MITISIIVTVLIGNIWFLACSINEKLKDIIRILELIKEDKPKFIFYKEEK